MRELVTDHAEDRIELSRLHGARGVEVDRDELLGELGVPIGEGTKLSLAAQTPAQRTKFKSAHLKDNARAVEEVLDQRFVARVDDICHVFRSSGRHGIVQPRLMFLKSEPIITP